MAWWFTENTTSREVYRSFICPLCFVQPLELAFLFAILRTHDAPRFPQRKKNLRIRKIMWTRLFDLTRLNPLRDKKYKYIKTSVGPGSRIRQSPFREANRRRSIGRRESHTCFGALIDSTLRMGWLFARGPWLMIASRDGARYNDAREGGGRGRSFLRTRITSRRQLLGSATRKDKRERKDG